MIVALSGFMGCGKSTLGPLVAARLGVPFVDTDTEIARRQGCSVAELWQSQGEAAFRALEAALVAELLASDVPRVLALGGGTVTHRATRHLTLDRACLVTLTAAPETILARVGDLAERPTLRGPDPLARIHALLVERRDGYAECHLSLSTDGLSVDEAVTRIASLAGLRRVVVPLGVRSYPVDIVDDSPDALSSTLDALAPSSLVVVSDDNVIAARGDALARALGRLSPAPQIVQVTLTPGESRKTLSSVQAIWDAALAARVDREAVVVGFGGGVVGDLAGFAASTLLRGLRTVLVPTTLLAMVDASVGGKTGFDHAAGKNLLGSFHQPSAVVADVAHLSTLPRRELVAGLAEVAKIALACDESLWLELEACAEELVAGNAELLARVVAASIRLKAKVVADDEREAGWRRVLNVGHTVGHAVEAAGEYARLVHGEAVAVGMAIEVEACERLGLTAAGVSGRVRALLARLELPTRISNSELAASWEYLASDKKRVGSGLHLPVIRRVGTASVEVVNLRELKDAVGEGRG